MRTRSATTAWTWSTFDRSPERVEWRVEGDRIQLRHHGHDEEGTLSLSLPEWKAFIAAAQDGQAGVVAY